MTLGNSKLPSSQLLSFLSITWATFFTVMYSTFKVILPGKNSKFWKVVSKKLWLKSKYWWRTAKLCLWRSLVLAGGYTLLSTNSVLGAEKIALQSGLLEFYLPISSLETYAQKGTVDSHLAFYAKRLEPKHLAKLRTLLNQKIPFDLITVADFFNSSSGEAILQLAGEFIKPAHQQNGFYALRSAIISAAAEPEQLTLLKVLKKFPTQTIKIDSNLISQVFQMTNQLTQKTKLAVTSIEQQAEVKTKNNSLKPDLLVNLTQKGNFTWQKQTLLLKDQNRHYPWGTLHERQFSTAIYHPQLTTRSNLKGQKQGLPLKKIPLIVISKGFGAKPSDFSNLAQHLASHGFAVTILERPKLKNNQEGLITNPLESNEFIDSPLDVSFLLDRLEKLNLSVSSRQRKIDTKNVAVMGHSFGGFTALALAGAKLDVASLRQECHSAQVEVTVGNPSMLLQCLAAKLPPNSISRLRDKRIKAVFVFNPVTSQIFGEQGLQQIKIPTMFVAGSNDLVTPALVEQICPFSKLKMRDRYLALIKGGTHLYLTEKGNNSLLHIPGLFNPQAFAASSYIKTLSLSFAKTYLAHHQPTESNYLNSAYASSISKAAPKLQLIQSFKAIEFCATSSK